MKLYLKLHWTRVNSAHSRNKLDVHMLTLQSGQNTLNKQHQEKFCCLYPEGSASQNWTELFWLVGQLKMTCCLGPQASGGSRGITFRPLLTCVQCLFWSHHRHKLTPWIHKSEGENKLWQRLNVGLITALIRLHLLDIEKPIYSTKFLTSRTEK